MKSALNFKNGLISLQQAGRFYRKSIQSQQEFEESLVISNVLKHTCTHWRSAISLYEATEAKLRVKRNDFVLRFAVPNAERAAKVGLSHGVSRKAR